MFVEDWFEVQGKEKESTVDREKLTDKRKARFASTDVIWYQPLGPFFKRWSLKYARSSIGTLRAGEPEQNRCSCWQLSTSQLILLLSHGKTSKEQEHPVISKRLSNLLARFRFAAALLCFRLISFTDCSKSLIFFRLTWWVLKVIVGSLTAK